MRLTLAAAASALVLTACASVPAPETAQPANDGACCQCIFD
jgi:starvation-inducible outer membrane lipoprotein